ncbi:MAG: NifB/NifX family molybdenum-iron cluster-binding protein [Halanaeroarchaeum sp.]
MYVCIPSLGDGGLEADVSAHFGRAPTFTVYDTDAETAHVVDNRGEHHGGHRSPPDAIADTGADVLVCGNLGRKAVDRFDDHGIDVYRGAEGTVAEALERWEAGDLDEAQPGDDCGHDHGHGGGHGHGHGEGHDHGGGHGHHAHH